MSGRTIWVVIGSTGEYSDSTNWLVCAYEDEASATRHADAAMIRAREFFKMNDRFSDRKTEAIRAFMGDLDPVGEHMDYTGTDYYVDQVNLREALTRSIGEEEP
jgi:hypothetical protein